MLLEEESVDMLNIIEKNHPSDVQTCCREMFALWLRTDTKASWNKLIVVLEQMDLKRFAENITEHVLKGILLSSQL